MRGIKMYNMTSPEEFSKLISESYDSTNRIAQSLGVRVCELPDLVDVQRGAIRGLDLRAIDQSRINDGLIEQINSLGLFYIRTRIELHGVSNNVNVYFEQELSNDSADVEEKSKELVEV